MQLERSPDVAEADSFQLKLLSDIYRVFDEQGTDRLPAKALLKALVELETENPQASWWEQDVPMTEVLLPGFGVGYLDNIHHDFRIAQCGHVIPVLTKAHQE